MPQRFNNIYQDFETIVLRNNSAQTKLQAKRKGQTETKKKNSMSAEAQKMAKLDNDMESTKVMKVTKVFSNTMRDARVAKGLTQKDLAHRAQIPVADVQKYENGSAVPNQQHISKIQRVLGINLSKLNKK